VAAQERASPASAAAFVLAAAIPLDTWDSRADGAWVQVACQPVPQKPFAP